MQQSYLCATICVPLLPGGPAFLWWRRQRKKPNALSTWTRARYYCFCECGSNTTPKCHCIRTHRAAQSGRSPGGVARIPSQTSADPLLMSFVTLAAWAMRVVRAVQAHYDAPGWRRLCRTLYRRRRANTPDCRGRWATNRRHGGYSNVQQRQHSWRGRGARGYQCARRGRACPWRCQRQTTGCSREFFSFYPTKGVRFNRVHACRWACVQQHVVVNMS